MATCVGARYTQHSTGVADGPEGFLEFFGPFLARNPKREIELVRIFEDGYHVFVHAYQSLNDGAARWVTTDLFDTDDEGLVVEHWDTIGAWRDDSLSGHSMIDGPTEIRDLERTAANKDRVRGYLREVLAGGELDRLERHVSRERFVQHDPDLGDGFDALREALGSGKERYDYVFKVVGQGDFVASLCRMRRGAAACAVFDLFRLEDDRIVEHWLNRESIAPRDQWRNAGKF